MLPEVSLLIGRNTFVITDCKAGPQIPPRQYGTKNANIIQPSEAKANNKPIAYMQVRNKYFSVLPILE
jgi:hypothetical protein